VADAAPGYVPTESGAARKVVSGTAFELTESGAARKVVSGTAFELDEQSVFDPMEFRGEN